MVFEWSIRLVLFDTKKGAVDPYLPAIANRRVFRVLD